MLDGGLALVHSNCDPYHPPHLTKISAKGMWHEKRRGRWRRQPELSKHKLNMPHQAEARGGRFDLLGARVK